MISCKVDLDKIRKVQDIIDAGFGDAGRNAFILECLHGDKKLYNTDETYLAHQTRLLESKIRSLQPSKKATVPKRTTAPMITDEEIDKILEKQDMKNTRAKDTPKAAVVQSSIKLRIKNIFFSKKDMPSSF